MNVKWLQSIRSIICGKGCTYRPLNKFKWQAKSGDFWNWIDFFIEKTYRCLFRLVYCCNYSALISHFLLFQNRVLSIEVIWMYGESQNDGGILFDPF